MIRRYFIVDREGREIPGADGPTSVDAWRDFPIPSLALSAGYSCRYERVGEPDAADVVSDETELRAGNYCGHNGSQRVVAAALADGVSDYREIMRRTGLDYQAVYNAARRVRSGPRCLLAKVWR